MRRRSLIWAQLLAFVFALGAFSVNATACEGGGGGSGELTSLSTTLSGGGKEGAELTVSEGTKVKDKATLTGKNASKATGKATYKVYSESACKTLVTSAGEVTVSGESVPASSEEELEAGKAYYWQAHYGGESKNAESTSPCTEILDVQAKTSLSTKLSGGGGEGEEISVNEGTKVKDKATLSGTNSSTAGGKVLYKIFSDSKCEHLVKEAGEESVSGGSVTASEEKELEGGKTYYWQATYKGDGLHKESSSECGKEILRVKAKTTLSTTLSGGGEEGAEITVNEGTKVKDKATVEGTNSSTAEGKVLYKVYSDSKCEHLVKEAGEKSVASGSGTASNEEELEGDAIYYWQATYKGDSLHQESKSTCGKEVVTVKAKTSLSTTLSGEGKESAELTVLEGAKVKDDATLGGSHSSSAGGKLVYKVYSDKECKTLVKEAGDVTVSSGSVSASSEEELEGGKTYYWQAHYEGDSLHEESNSECGKEILRVKAKTTLSTILSGGGKEGAEITVNEGSRAKDKATVEGTNSSRAEGKVIYKVFSDSKCEHLVAEAGEKSVSSGSATASNEEELEGGKTYYWQAHYEGDGLHQESTSECGSEILNVKAKTTLATTLSGEGKEGTELTIIEGSKVKDDATLEGTNASTATGKVTYKVYSDKECKDLVAEAGEKTVSSGSVPASNEEELEGAKTYYWQASYDGDSLHEESNSGCSEILNVKAKTALTTTLAGEGREGAELTVLEGVKVDDDATLSGSHSSSAGGKVVYKVYSDKECKTLVTTAGEETVSSGSVPASSEEELEGGKAYYWQASYGGDSLHAESNSGCSEILNVKAKTTLTTSLVGEESPGETRLEGEDITVAEDATLGDTATLNGTGISKASGTVKYNVYADKECRAFLKEAGERNVSGGSVEPSNEESFEVGVYYWQAVYSGDVLHQGATSTCGSEVATVKAATSLTTRLSGEDQEGETITVAEGASVGDSATLSGADASMATGTVKYAVYADGECSDMVAEAGEVSVSGEFVPPSDTETLPPGTYYWQASYSGDGVNHGVKSTCGSEISVVTPLVSTALSGGGQSGGELEVTESAAVSDKATLHGEHSSTATGTVKYEVYSDNECNELVATAGEISVHGASVPASSEETLPAGTYYWQADYSGDAHDPAAESTCGAEVVVVQTPTSLATSLMGEGKTGETIEVEEGSTISDRATLSGANASTATGYVEYNVYSESECKSLVTQAGDVSVTGGSVPVSSEVTLPNGTYYWQATYYGEGENHSSTSSCGSEISVVSAPLTILLSGDGHSGEEIEVPEGDAVRAKATLHGEYASIATGAVKYEVYSDSKCEDAVAEAGEVAVSGESVPVSTEEILAPGTNYWQAEYSGDPHNPPAKSACNAADSTTLRTYEKYAALGDSYSAGEGTGNYYGRTDLGGHLWGTRNVCHRSPVAWPARVAEAIYGAGATLEDQVFQQQPDHFIFRACSEAVAENLWSSIGGASTAVGGQWNELIEGPPSEWLHTPAQDLWLELPGGEAELNAEVPPQVVVKPNNAIGLVTLTIGGNDAGFATVAASCIESVVEAVNFIRGYNVGRCQEVIAEWEQGKRKRAGTIVIPSKQEGVPSIGPKLEVILNDIHTSAPNARIRIPLYPRILDTTLPGAIYVGNGFYILGGIAKRIEKLVNTLNAKIRTTVEAWAGKTGVNARVIPGTVDAFIPAPPAARHQLGDREPWVNGVFLPVWTVESFHPTCLGHKALAEKVLQSLGVAVPGGWAC